MRKPEQLTNFTFENPTPHVVDNTLRYQSKRPGRIVTGEWEEKGVVFVSATVYPYGSAQSGTLDPLSDSLKGAARLIIKEVKPPPETIRMKHAREAYQSFFEHLTKGTPDAFLILPPDDNQPFLDIPPNLQEYLDNITAAPHKVIFMAFDSHAIAIQLKRSGRNPKPARPIKETLSTDSRILLDTNGGTGQFFTFDEKGQPIPSQTQPPFAITPDVLFECMALMPKAVLIPPKTTSK